MMCGPSSNLQQTMMDADRARIDRQWENGGRDEARQWLTEQAKRDQEQAKAKQDRVDETARSVPVLGPARKALYDVMPRHPRASDIPLEGLKPLPNARRGTIDDIRRNPSETVDEAKRRKREEIDNE